MSVCVWGGVGGSGGSIFPFFFLLLQISFTNTIHNNIIIIA